MRDDPDESDIIREAIDQQLSLAVGTVRTTV